EDGRLQLRIVGVPDFNFHCSARNTQIANLESVIVNGFALGGNGITGVVHSQLLAFHMMDACVKESTRTSMSEANRHQAAP
ncbi:MAG: hypothetical protein ACKPKO_41085, partial [Candidatus Fonsibacter sp.]